MRMPSALYSTSSKSSKLERAKIGVEHSLLLIVSKALWATFVYSKLPFFIHSIKGSIMEPKSLMNR